MNESNLINYYNKFNEDKRLTRRHGIVEFNTTIKYIEKYLSKYSDPFILDVGAGTGAYSIYFHDKGYRVNAIELVKSNLMKMKHNSPSFPAFQGNALDLSRYSDNTFDIVFLFGPLYHLISYEDKFKAINEAKRVLKPKGLLFISYYMNEYGIIKHGFMEGNIVDAINKKEINENFEITPKDTDLYSFVRLDIINKLMKESNMKRLEIISQDGPTDYLRPIINKMSNEEFDIYMNYVYKISSQEELLGASSHVLDILEK